MRRRRAVVLARGRAAGVGDAGGLHRALLGRPARAVGLGLGSTTTCSTGTAVAPRTRSIRFERSQPERSPGSVEITTSSTLNSSSAFITAV